MQQIYDKDGTKTGNVKSVPVSFFSQSFFTICIKNANLSIKERKVKFKKFSNDLNIKLIKGNRNFILYMKDYINNGKKI